MAYPGFTISSVVNITPTNTSQTVAGTASAYLITNTGTSAAYFLTASSVTFNTGIVLFPGSSMYVLGTTLSVIGLGSQLNIALGS